MQNTSAARGSGPGVLVFGGMIAATLVVGFFMRRDAAKFERAVRGALPLTQASATLIGTGIDRDAVARLHDDDRRALVSKSEFDLAMWAKVFIPGGRRNRPPVRFDVRDDRRLAFPFRTSWVGDSAYLLFPRGYARPPARLTVVARQGLTAVGRFDLPQLPAPIAPPPPLLLPAWPGLSVVHVAWLDKEPGVKGLLVDPGVATGDVTATELGTSASIHDECSGDVYFIKQGTEKGAAYMPLRLFFPATTKIAYVELTDKGPNNVLVHKARIAVALDQNARVPVQKQHFRIAATPSRVAGGGVLGFGRVPPKVNPQPLTHASATVPP